jgi:WXG100 family type VII secretion target
MATIDGIQVATQALTDTASKVLGINGTLNAKLADCNSAMNALENSWDSDASKDIRGAMNALKPKFEQYKGVVDSYCKFLQTTAQTYEDTEAAIQGNAGAFK